MPKSFAPLKRRDHTMILEELRTTLREFAVKHMGQVTDLDLGFNEPCGEPGAIAAVFRIRLFGHDIPADQLRKFNRLPPEPPT